MAKEQIFDSVGVEIKSGCKIEIVTDLANVGIVTGQKFVVSGLEYGNQVIVYGPKGATVVAGRNVRVI